MGAQQALHLVRRQERIARGDPRGQRVHPIDREIAPGQRNPRRPRPARGLKERRKLFQRAFGEPAIGGDLAAEHVQQRRAVAVEAEHIVPRRRRGRARPVIVKRPDPGIGPDHLPGRDRPGEIAACEGAQIVAFLVGAARLAGRAVMVHVGRPDQREVLFVGDRKDDPPVGALKEIAAVVVVKPGHDDMAAAHQPHALAGRDVGDLADHLFDPRAARVDQRPRAVDLPAACAAIARLLGRHLPQIARPHGIDDPRARQDPRASGLGVARVQHHQPRVLHPAVGIFPADPEAGLQRLAQRIARQVQPPRARQDPPPAHVVIKKQPQPDQPGRAAPAQPGHHHPQKPRGRGVCVEPHLGRPGQHEAHRPAYVGHRDQQRLAFVQRLAHQAELEELQIAQPAMEQLGRGRRGRMGQITHLGQRDRQAAPGGVAGDPAAVHAAPDDEKIRNRPVLRLHRTSPRTRVPRKLHRAHAGVNRFFRFCTAAKGNEHSQTQKNAFSPSFGALARMRECPRLARRSLAGGTRWR